MKTYRNVIAAALTLAFVTAFAGFAAAQGHGMMGGMGDMTPEKQATMQKLHGDFDAATTDLRKQLFAKEAELDSVLYAEKVDEKKVDALTREINDLNANIYAERIKMHKAMAKEGIMPMGGKGMMGGKGGCPMMGGGMNKMGGGMQHGMMGGMQHDMSGAGNGTGGNAPMNHNSHAPAQQ